MRIAYLVCAAAIAASSAAVAADGRMMGFVDFMLRAQSHHAKLWLAGQARNWELADYLRDEIEEGLEEAGKSFPEYKGVPVGKMIDGATKDAIKKVEAAIKAKNRDDFARAYDELTASCNACHQAANRGFLVMRRPASSSFPNQNFAPVKR